MITYCNYKGEKKFPGDKWTSKECEKCSCTADEGLKCCKYVENLVIDGQSSSHLSFLLLVAKQSEYLLLLQIFSGVV